MCNGHPPTDTSVRSGVAVMCVTAVVVAVMYVTAVAVGKKGNGFILVSECLPGFISAL